MTLNTLREAAAGFGGDCLSSEYKSLRTRMRWRCANGHEWESQAQNVRRGKWCLRCSGKMRKTIEEMQANREATRREVPLLALQEHVDETAMAMRVRACLDG